MRIKTKMIFMALLGTVAHGIVCAENTTAQANGQPVPARRYDVAAYVWPAYQFKDERWNQIFKQGIGEWEIIRECKPGFPGHEQPNVPLWGYEDESDPKVMEKKIASAVKYGVNVFIYDWYWYDNQPFLEKGINDGFLKANNCKDMQFYLMWANHDAGSGVWDKKKTTNLSWRGAVDRATFDTVVDRVISKYMKQPNYYKIDGKPVFSVYELGTLIRGLGGVEQTKDALASFRSKVKAAGFPDLHFQTILWGAIPDSVSQVPGDKTQSRNNTVTSLGIDSLTSYQWVHSVGPGGLYSDWAGVAVGQWSGWAKEYSIPYFPHVSVGWDTNPRRTAYDPGTVFERSPERFQAALESARQHVDQRGLHPLITINAWNEWSEGSNLEPDERYGYKFLEAVKNVFGANGSGRSVSATPQWIWAPEPGQSALNALSGKRWFRATYTVPANRTLKAATVQMTADNEFTLFINGQQIGAGTDWQSLFTADITQVVKPGPLVIAVAATNQGAPGERGPAGLLGCVQLDFTEGEPLRFSTSEKWSSRDQEVTGWQDPNNQTGTWTPVEVIGHNGTAPWKWFALNGRGN